ncbi:MAG: hypothetical protein VKL41_18740 [Snowella sp.]|jgi:hypothetical protein|nr:hypothetical protein [Snowella sp.]
MPTNEEQSKILDLIYRLQKEHGTDDILFDLILKNRLTEEELKREKSFFEKSFHAQKLEGNPKYRQEQEEKKQKKINLATYHLEELENNGYVTLKWTTQFLSGPPPSIDSVRLTTKGKIAIEDPSSIQLPTESFKLILETVMGDKYENITNSTIINRSSLENAFNQIKEQVDEETANALIQVAEIVGQSNNPAAGVLLTSFTDEVKSKEPDKSKLSQYWNGLVTVLPSVATLSTACAKIIPLFT